MTTRAEVNARRARRLADADAPPAERYINGRRVRAHATVDEYGQVYALPKRGRVGDTIARILTIGLLGWLAWLILVRAAAPMDSAAQPPQLDTRPPLASPHAQRPAALPFDNGAPPIDVAGTAAAYNAEQLARRAAIAAQDHGTPTPAATAAPTATWAFWSPADLAAFTATAEAFYNPELIPTAPPAFQSAVEKQCAAATPAPTPSIIDVWCAGLGD